MGKTAFIFPGQGAQCAGMGKDFYEQYKESAEVIDKAQKAVGLDLKELCFTPNDRLDQTEYTQIAMVAVEIAMLRAVNSRGLVADVAAGLSLGEYSALAAAAVMDDEDIFRVVRQRGILMQNAYPTGGGMSAVLGLDADTTAAVCKEVADATKAVVSVANYNCPGQIVITGEKTAVDAAAAKLTEAGAKRVIPLNVSGPFHSSLLTEASNGLKEALADVAVADPKIPYVTNVTADFVTTCNDIKDLLARQITSSVRWQQSIERMAADGVDTFIEIGPGKTLSGFMKKINPDLRSYRISTTEELDKVLEEINA